MPLSERNILFVGNWLNKIELEVQNAGMHCNSLMDTARRDVATAAGALDVMGLQASQHGMCLDSIQTAITEMRAVLGEGSAI